MRCRCVAIVVAVERGVAHRSRVSPKFKVDERPLGQISVGVEENRVAMYFKARRINR